MLFHAGRNTYAGNRVFITHSTGLSTVYPLCPEDMHRASQARGNFSRVTWVTGRKSLSSKLTVLADLQYCLTGLALRLQLCVKCYDFLPQSLLLVAPLNHERHVHYLST